MNSENPDPAGDASCDMEATSTCACGRRVYGGGEVSCRGPRMPHGRTVPHGGLAATIYSPLVYRPEIWRRQTELEHAHWRARSPALNTSPPGAQCCTYETDVTARKPRSENARGLTTVGEAWDYMEQVHHAYVHDLYISSVRTSDP